MPRLFSVVASVSFLLFLVLTSSALAQSGRYEIRGIVADSAGESLPGATVVALAADSTILSFGVTRASGEFRLDRVPAGDLLLQVTFLGFEQHTQSITITDSSLDVGEIILNEADMQFDELFVTGDHIPLLMRRDTLDYNAMAFRVPPNANVEELLRRLPGIDVDTDGTIRAQGEVVSRLLVDGREFFSSDPTMATRNLPADAVERVQVYDRQSDTAELTGLDDGAGERTINLQLREDRRSGMFGNLTGAVGDPERFEVRGNVNRFSPGSQLALIANANNVNQEGFQMSDAFSFAGGSFGGGMMQFLPTSSGQADGFSTTLSGGLNFNRDFGPNTVLQSSYLVYYRDRERASELLQRDVADGPLSSLITEDNLTNDTEMNHRLRLDLKHTFDEGHDLQFITNARLGTNSSDSERFRITERLDGDASNTNSRLYDSSSNTLTGNAQLIYRRRLAPGRTIVAEAHSSLERYDADSDLETITRFLEGGNELTTEEIHQIQDQLRNQQSHRQKLTYTEPLGRRQLLEFEVEHNLVMEDRDYATFDVVDGTPVINPQLSTAFDRSYRQLRGSAGFRHSVDPINLSFGVIAQHTNLDNPTIADAPTFLHILPRASLRYQFAQQTHLNLNYSTSTREPSMRDMQPFVETSDPLNLYVGNPSINPTYNHNVWLSFFHFDAFAMSNLFANVGFSYMNNAIVSSRSIDEDLRQISTVENVDGLWSANMNLYYGHPIRRLGIRVNLSASPTYNYNVEFVNAERNESNLFRSSFGVALENLTKDVLDVQVSATYTYNDVRYTLNPVLNRSYLNRSFFGSATYEFLPGWRIGSRINYHMYSAEVFGSARNVPLWGAHLSWMPPGLRSEIRLEGHDLLNQNIGMNFTNTASYIREQRTASLGRFIMIKWIYNLTGQSSTPSGPRTMIIGG